jgi:hypothetical protein
MVVIDNIQDRIHPYFTIVSLRMNDGTMNAQKNHKPALGHIYQRRQKLIDKFINDKFMSHSSSDNKSVAVTMGAAIFSSTKEIAYHKALSAKAIVVMVNECNTSPK